MKKLLDKLNYKERERIAVLNAEEVFINSLSSELSGVVIDKEIDHRFPYAFIIIFVKSISDVENFTPDVLHNLVCDGVMWFCYPKKTSKRFSSDLDRDHGWQTLNDRGFHGIRVVAIDQDWSAMRFRSIKFIRSSSKRFKI